MYHLMQEEEYWDRKRDAAPVQMCINWSHILLKEEKKPEEMLYKSKG